MGVMNCGRAGCQNILCDRYSPTYGYICNGCFDELVKSGPTTDIKDFMFTEICPDTESEAYARYDEVFKFA